MKNEKLVLGLDYGTDSVRALIADAEDGEEISSSVCYYPRWKEEKYCDPAKNQFRQHPKDYLETLENSIKKAIHKAPKGTAEKIKAISIDTTGSTPAAVNQHCTPLALYSEFEHNPDAMFILWKDHTAVEEADEINHLSKTWGGGDYTKGGLCSFECFWPNLKKIVFNFKEFIMKGFKLTLLYLCGSPLKLKLKRKFFLLLTGGSLFLLNLSLYAASEPGATLRGKDSILSLIIKGGPVMIPLGLFSIVALTVALERLMSLRKNAIFPQEIIELLQKDTNDTRQILDDIFEKSVKKENYFTRVLVITIKKWRKQPKLETIRTAVEEAAARETNRMKRSIRPLKIIGGLAPLLGLLGTVFGMIKAFQTVALSHAAFGKAEKLATGIYEAMVTTAAGLSIAIPTLLVFYFLNGKIDGYIDYMEEILDNLFDKFQKLTDKNGT